MYLYRGDGGCLHTCIYTNDVSLLGCHLLIIWGLSNAYGNGTAFCTISKPFYLLSPIFL